MLQQEADCGFMVRRLGLEQIFEIFQAREALEGMAARLACRRGGDPMRAKLHAIRQKIVKADIASGPALGIALGRELYRAIIEAAHNKIMAEIQERLENLKDLTAKITKRSPGIEMASANAYLRVSDAILDQNESQSEQAMREHLRETCRKVIDQFYQGMLER